MTKSDAFNRILLVLLALPVLLILVIAYQQLSPVMPVVIESVTIVTPEATPGGSIRYAFKYCQSATNSPVVYRQLIPEDLNNTITIPAVLGVVRPGCHTNSIVLAIPVGVHPGNYRLRGTVVYAVNSFRSVTITYNSTNTVAIK
jgi:hypothetical protein